MKETAALVLAVLAISWASILIRLSTAPPLVISFYRLAIAAAILLPFVALGRMRRARWQRPQQDHETALTRSGRGAVDPERPAGAALATLAAGILLGLHFASWITSLQLTSVASSVVLVTTTPIFAALLSSRLLGEPAGRAAWAGIAFSVLGSSLIGLGDAGRGPDLSGPVPQAAGSALTGDLLALAGAFFAAAYLTIGRRVRARMPLAAYLTAVYSVGAAAVALWILLRGQPLLGYPPREYLLFAAIAIFPNLVGHSLLNWAVRRIRTYVVNVASLGEAVLASVYAALIFGEIPGVLWYLGAVLIGAGVVTIVLAERSRGVVDAAAL